MMMVMIRIMWCFSKGIEWSVVLRFLGPGFYCPLA